MPGYIIWFGASFASAQVPKNQAAQAAVRPISEDQLKIELGKRYDWDFEATSLEDVVEHLRTHCRLPARLDVQSLEDAAVDPTQQIVFIRRDLTVRGFLSLALEQLELTWILRNGELVITIHEQSQTSKAHNIADLVAGDGQTDVEGAVQSVRQLLTAVVDPDGWGNGDNDPKLQRTGKLMVVQQLRENQDLIEALLGTLRRARDRRLAEPANVSPLDLDPSTTALRAALERRVVLAAGNEPLNEWVRRLAREQRIHIFLNGKTLEDASVDAKGLIEYGPMEVSLVQGLREIAATQELSLQYDENTLIITTTEEAASKPILRVYPIWDLLKSRTAEGLAEEIESSVRPDDWDVAGGSAVLNVVGPLGVLVVSHIDEGHAAVEQFLVEKRRKTKR